MKPNQFPVSSRTPENQIHNPKIIDNSIPLNYQGNIYWKIPNHSLVLQSQNSSRKSLKISSSKADSKELREWNQINSQFHPEHHKIKFQTKNKNYSRTYFEINSIIQFSKLSHFIFNIIKPITAGRICSTYIFEVTIINIIVRNSRVTINNLFYLTCHLKT